MQNSYVIVDIININCFGILYLIQNKFYNNITRYGRKLLLIIICRKLSRANLYQLPVFYFYVYTTENIDFIISK